MADSRDITGKNRKFTGTGGIKVPSGTAAQRVNEAGTFRFNTDTNLAEYYDGTDWKPIDAPPTITGFTVDGGSSVTSAEINRVSGDATIVINGSNFDITSGTVVFESEGGGANVSTQTLTRTSSSSFTVTVTRTDFLTANDPYAIKLTNGSGLAATLASAITANDPPVFTTAADTTVKQGFEGQSAPFSETTLAATDAEGDTITYSISAGALPPGVTINSSTAALEGTVSGSSVQNYTFTVQAATSKGNATRQFIFQVITEPAYTIEYLVLAGGGAGGGSHRGGGGGAGGYRNSYASETSGRNSSTETPWSVTSANGAITVTVGSGGAVSSAANGGTGGTSSISASGQTTITSYGGGGGGEYQNQADAGTYGSGAGAGHNTNVAQSGSNGTAGQGFDGGDTPTSGNPQGGCGGGAGANGQDGGSSSTRTGGTGLASSITGSSVTRGGGGGGGSYGAGEFCPGGAGGGGGGGSSDPADAHSGVIQSGDYRHPASGTDGLGGGGGGVAGDNNNTTYGRGGSGVVILRMPTSRYTGTTTGSPSVSTDGTDTILTFTGSGSYTC